jgi:hypothetical protein
VDLWTKINEVQLVKGTSNGINWKFTNSAASAYKTQFEGMIDFYDGCGLEELGSSQA